MTFSSSSSSMSSSEQTGESDAEELLEPILDLDEALEEALGDLDSVSSMEMDDNPMHLTTNDHPLLSSHHHVASSVTTVEDDPSASVLHTANFYKRQQQTMRGRSRKQSFSGNAFDGSVDIPGLGFSLSDLMNFDVTLF